MGPRLVVERASPLAASADEAFAWHGRPGSFERLVPPWEAVRIAGQHPGIRSGTRLRLMIAVGPFETEWVHRHEDIETGLGFVDLQETGPFESWRHRHSFEPTGPGSCLLRDQIEASVPGGPLGALLEPMIERRLDRALAYRHSTTQGDLELHGRFRPAPRLRVAISGSTGLIGQVLVAMLTSGGHSVVRLVRRPPAPGEVRWDPVAGRCDAEDLAGIDAVVHLAGENLAAGRWTDNTRQRIRESRVRGTGVLAQAIARCSRPPRVLVSASALGFYGDHGDETLDERAAAGTGFLSDVCRQWEAASEPAQTAKTRVVLLRFGIVLSPSGGALHKMLPPFEWGLGGPLGSGRQWMSWVSLDDCCGCIVYALLNEALAGPVNVVAPGAVTNQDFTTTLARVLRRPAALRVPASVLRTLFGDLADEALLASTRAVPRALREAGFGFRHPDLQTALRHLLGRPG